MSLAGPYRENAYLPSDDPRVEAETLLVHARAKLMDEISRGLALANEIDERSPNSFDYERRLSALESLYRTVCGG